MTENENTNPPATLPDHNEKPLALVWIEEYSNQADLALKKIEESLNTLRASLTQRERELMVITGQKALLLELQKKMVQQPKE